MDEIISKVNDHIKQVVSLRNKRCKHAPVFLIEGLRELQRALTSGYVIQKVFYSSKWYQEQKLFIDELRKKKIKVFSCHQNLMDTISYKEKGEKIIAIAEKKADTKDIFLSKRKNKHPFYLIVEGIEKPGNIGALFRTADACSIDGIILCDSMVDIYNPNVVRASLGAIFSVPVWTTSIESVSELIKREQWSIFVGTPDASIEYYKNDFKVPLALVFGSEKDGVTSFWKQPSFTNINIPMMGEVDSLNLSVSIGIIAYEVVRQRSIF